MTIYIICPFHRVTGGVELAHQLCYAINTLTDVKAFMWYINIDNCTQETIIVDHEPPVEYVMYQTECAKSFQEIDREENVVVVPESMTVFMKLIDHAKMALWWMSVDNLFIPRSFVKTMLFIIPARALRKLNHLSKRQIGLSGLPLRVWIEKR